MVSFEEELRMLLKTGRVEFGSKKAVKAVKLGKAKMVILASNAPPQVVKDIKYYSRFSKTPIYVFEGTSLELGTLCGRPHLISAITVLDPGDSNILALVGSLDENVEE